MAIHKIKSGRVSSLTADQYIGQAGTIFYNESVGDLRLSDGKTLGGIPLSSGSLGSNGATGVQGYEGATGPAGATGIQGASGASGSAGLTGATGPATG